MEPDHRRRMHDTLEHPCVCNDKAIDKTRLFSVNQLAFTHVESKFCMSRLWIEVYYVDLYESRACYISHRDDLVGHSATLFAITSLFAEVATNNCPNHGKSSSICSFLNFLIKFSTTWLDEDIEFRNSCIKSWQTRLTNEFHSTISQ